MPSQHNRVSEIPSASSIRDRDNTVKIGGKTVLAVREKCGQAREELLLN